MVVTFLIYVLEAVFLSSKLANSQKSKPRKPAMILPRPSKCLRSPDAASGAAKGPDDCRSMSLRSRAGDGRARIDWPSEEIPGGIR